MTPPNLQPEQQAREQIDRALEAAGWVIQNHDEINLYAARGVAVREYPMARGHGRADYLLHVDHKAVGALEAKKVGVPLTGVEPQARMYSQGLPAKLSAPIRPLPFLYASTGVKTMFTNRLDPFPRSREIFAPQEKSCAIESNSRRADTLPPWPGLAPSSFVCASRRGSARPRSVATRRSTAWPTTPA